MRRGWQGILKGTKAKQSKSREVGAFQSNFISWPHSGYVHVTVYLERFGFGILSIEPHISHCTFSVSGPFGAGASAKVRPTSCDQPSESLYLSAVVFILDCLRESRILRFFFPFLPPDGAFLAMGLVLSLCVDVFNDFAS